MSIKRLLFITTMKEACAICFYYELRNRIKNVHKILGLETFKRAKVSLLEGF